MSTFQPGAPAPAIAGATLTPGMLVKRDAADGKVKPLATSAVIALGRNLSYATDGEACHVQEAYPGVRFTLPYSGDFTAAMTGKAFGITVTNGVATVDLTDTVNTLVVLKAIVPRPDGRKEAEVEVLYTKSQAVIEVA